MHPANPARAKPRAFQLQALLGLPGRPRDAARQPASHEPHIKTMSQFRPSYDRVFSKNKLPDYEYQPTPKHGVLEGALLKRKSKKWPLKDARWKRYWVVADGKTLRYFRNERSDDDELRKLKPSNGAIARKRVPLELCSVARTQGGRPGFEVKVDDEGTYAMQFACDGESERDKWVGHLEAMITDARALARE